MFSIFSRLRLSRFNNLASYAGYNLTRLMVHHKGEYNRTLFIRLVKLISVRLETSAIDFRSLFKASDTFDDFQVLIKMADSHRNCQHHYDFKTLAMF